MISSTITCAIKSPILRVSTPFSRTKIVYKASQFSSRFFATLFCFPFIFHLFLFSSPSTARISPNTFDAFIKRFTRRKHTRQSLFSRRKFGLVWHVENCGFSLGPDGGIIVGGDLNDCRAMAILENLFGGEKEMGSSDGINDCVGFLQLCISKGG